MSIIYLSTDVVYAHTMLVMESM